MVPGFSALLFAPGEDHTIPRRNPERVLAGLGSAHEEPIACPGSHHVVSLDGDAPMVRVRILDLVRSP